MGRFGTGMRDAAVLAALAALLPTRVAVAFDAQQVSVAVDPQGYFSKSISNPLLDQVVTVMTERPKIRIRIEGHTDSAGAERYNATLSQRRADAVQRYLVDKGVDASRLEATGFDETQPVATNDAPDGRELNRRTEFHFVVTSGTPN